jgi:hypothetical protein
MLIGMVDCVFADVAQPDQARIVGLNAQYFLKNQGHFVISIKVCECLGHFTISYPSLTCVVVLIFASTPRW